MLMFGSTPPVSMSPTPPQIADLRLAASQMTGATRRAFQAEMTLKYCDGNARRAEDIFGWGRHNIAVAAGVGKSGIPRRQRPSWDSPSPMRNKTRRFALLCPIRV